MDFAAQEAVDGVRYTWNCWPSSKAEAARIGQMVPMSMMFTPLKANLPSLPTNLLSDVVLPYLFLCPCNQ